MFLCKMHCRRRGGNYKYTDTRRVTIIVSLMRVVRKYIFLLWVLTCTLKSLGAPSEATRKILLLVSEHNA